LFVEQPLNLLEHVGVEHGVVFAVVGRVVVADLAEVDGVAE
jgi:hypothetical protein